LHFVAVINFIVVFITCCWRLLRAWSSVYIYIYATSILVFI